MGPLPCLPVRVSIWDAMVVRTATIHLMGMPFSKSAHLFFFFLSFGSFLPSFHVPHHSLGVSLLIGDVIIKPFSFFFA